MIESSDVQTVPEAAPWKPMARAVGGALALYLAYSLGIFLLNAHPPQLPPAMWAVFGAASTIVYLFIIVFAIRLMTRLTMSAHAEGIALGVSLLLFLALNPMVWQAVALLRTGTRFSDLFAALTASNGNSTLDLIVPFFLILTGTFFGRLIARIIRERAILVPVGIIAGLIDFWGVYWGPVNDMSASAPAAVSGIGSAATVAAAVPDTAMQTLSGPLAVLAQVTPPDSIGIGDFVFLALFLACAYRLGFSVKRTMWGLFTGLLVACAIMALDQQTIFGHDIAISYLPGLPFICGGVLLANLRGWRLSRQEWAMTGVLIVLLGALIGVSVVRTQMSKPHNITSQYVLPVTADSQVVTRALAHINEGNDTPAQVIPLEGQFVYAYRPHGTVLLTQWAVMTLTHKEKVTLRSSWECALYGMRPKGKSEWQIAQESTSPPLNAVARLRATAKGKDIDLIRQATGIPPTAFTVLDRAAAYGKLANGKKAFMIRLLPEGGAVINEAGKVVAKIPYTAGK